MPAKAAVSSDVSAQTVSRVMLIINVKGLANMRGPLRAI